MYEHHTELLDRTRLLRHLELFRSGGLADQRVFEDGGHGCVISGKLAGSFARTVVLGPRRAMLYGVTGIEFPAPGGDIMLAGCFGLLKGWKHLRETEAH